MAVAESFIHVFGLAFHVCMRITCGKRWDLSKFVDVLSVSFHNRSYIEVLAQFHPGIACPPRSQSGTTIQGEDC